MNKTWLKKYVLPAIIAVTVPITANAQDSTPTFTAPDLVVNGHDGSYEYGVAIDPTGTASMTGAPGSPPNTPNTIGYWDGTKFARFTGPETVTANGNIYQFQNVTTNSTKIAEGSTGAVATSDTTGKYTFNNISATGATNVTAAPGKFEVHGVMINGADFAGTLNAEKISVVGGKKADAFFGSAYGVTVYNNSTDGWGTVSGDIKIGSIELSGEQGTGFVAGSIVDGANVDIGNIALNMTGFAMGAEIAVANSGAPNLAGDIADGATFNIGTINVTSTDAGAAGIRVDGGVNANAAAKVGAITVTGKTGAFGIIAENDHDGSNGGSPTPASLAGLTVTDNIIAKSENGEAYGITGENVEFTVANTGKEIQILGNAAGAGIQTVGTGALTANLDEGANLKVSSTNAGGNLTVTGEGAADLGVTKVTGATDIQDTAAVTFAMGSTFTGSTSKNADASVTLFGETRDAATEGAWSNVEGVQIKTDMGNFVSDGSGHLVSTGTSSVSNGVIAATSVHQTYSTWNTVRNHMISAGDFGGYTGDNSGDYRGQECDPCDPIGACDPCGSFGNKQLQRTAWVNYIGRGEEYNGANASKWNLGVDGVQAGTDLYVTRRNQLGVNLGYEKGDLVNGLNSVDSENMYLGLYGAHIFRTGWDVRGSFTYGWQEFDMVRLGNNGTSLYGSNVDGNTTESSIEFGKRFARGAWSLRPVFGVDVMTTALDASKESALNLGGNALSYSKGDMTQVFLRTGAELRWQKRRLGFNSGIFYSYDVDNDTMQIKAENNAAASTVLSGTDVGREMLMFNVGGSYALGRSFTVFGGYQGQAVLNTDSDAYQNVGYVGGAWKW